MKISKYNEHLPSAASVDIEDMPLELAKQLVEALTIIKITTGDFYSETVEFRQRLKDAIER